MKKIFYFTLFVLISCTKNDANNPSNLPNVLTVEVTPAINILQTVATINGNVLKDGGSAITAKGICWGTGANPTTSNSKTTLAGGLGSFSSTLTGLSANTTYYYRAYAINGQTTAYSAEYSFLTKPFVIAGTGVTDVEGNAYTSIILGDKEWMAQNLRTTKYRNGDVIPNKTVASDWTFAGSSSLGAWCHYNNTTGYNATYGKLYNWFAITDTRGIAPTGWHIPSMGEWAVLSAYLGGDNSSGGVLKEAGFSNWASPNTGATNAVGFTSLPGGSRSSTGAFSYFGTWGIWGSTDIGGFNQMALRSSTAQKTENYFNNSDGLSIRCIKD